MLSPVLAHRGGPQGIDDLWLRWDVDAIAVVGVVGAFWLYRRGTRRSRHPPATWRARCFWVGAAAIAAAVLWPLDLLAAELASAHMVQHVLLLLVAAPLLAHSAAATTLLRGAPRWVRRRTGRARRHVRAATQALETLLRRPAVVWLLHVATLWFWHASVPYDAALEHSAVHAVEHATFLGTGILFWSALRPRGANGSDGHGYSALLVFAMAMQSVFLGVLLTFASTAWYAGYRETTQAWGLEPLADQQLAGVIMWVPAGLIYVVAGVLLVAAWVRGGASGAGPSLDDDWGAGAAPDRPAVTRS